MVEYILSLHYKFDLFFVCKLLYLRKWLFNDIHNVEEILIELELFRLKLGNVKQISYEIAN